MTRKPYSETALVNFARECRAVQPDHFFFAPLTPSNLRGLVLLRVDRRVRCVTEKMKAAAQERGYHAPWWSLEAPPVRIARVPEVSDPVWRRVAKRLG